MGHLFDIACNFSSERFDNDLQDVIQRAIENKVNKLTERQVKKRQRMMKHVRRKK